MLSISQKQLSAISAECIGQGESELRIEPADDGALLVTEDAGYGEYSFWVSATGEATPAGMGQRVARHAS